MANPHGMYPASVYRAQARTALVGRWKSVLLVPVVIALLNGTVIGVSFYWEESADLAGYSILNVVLGPIQSQTLWRDGRLVQDAADVMSMLGLVPFSRLLAICVAAVAVLLLILLPICRLGSVRVGLEVADGKLPSLDVLRVSWREYWRVVAVDIGAGWRAVWPGLLLIGIGVVLMLVFDVTATFFAVLLILAATVVMCMRAMYYTYAMQLLVLHPEMNSSELVRESRRLMEGCRARNFWLGMSFAGWVVLYVVAVSVILNITAIFFPASLLINWIVGAVCVLMALPLGLYLNVANVMFLRDRLQRDEKKDAQ